MSRIWATVADGSTKDALRDGLAQQGMMLTNPSSFFWVWFLCFSLFYLVL